MTHATHKPFYTVRQLYDCNAILSDTPYRYTVQISEPYIIGRRRFAGNQTFNGPAIISTLLPGEALNLTDQPHHVLFS